MFIIGIDQRQSAAVISRITAHLPAGMSLGRIRAVTEKGIIADGTFGYDRAGDFAWRLFDIGGGRYEITEWHDGEELSRRIVHEGPLREGR